MKKVEVVARTLFPEWYVGPHKSLIGGHLVDTSAEDLAEMHRYCERQATKAISALADPSPEMVAAGNEAVDYEIDDCPAPNVSKIFDAMIGALIDRG